MTTRRQLVNTLLTKQAHREQEKTAFVSYLKPINKALTGDALISRIAPLGNRRILSELGHGATNFLAGAAPTYAATGDALSALAGGGAMSALGNLGHQARANKYITQALAKGPNRLSKRQLGQLLKQMGTAQTAFGSDGLVELIMGLNAKKRIKDAYGSRLMFT